MTSAPAPIYRRLFNFMVPLPEPGCLPGNAGEQFLAPLQERNWAGAVVFYEGLLRLCPEHPAIVNALACVRFNLAEDDAAFGLLSELLRRAPENLWVLNNFAVVAGMRGDFATARERLEEACRRAGSGCLADDLVCNRACVENAAGEFVAARRFFREVLARNPDHHRALFGLSRLSQEMNWLDEAERCCRRLVELVPGEAEYRQNLGFVLLKQGRWDEGFSLYESRWEVSGRRLPHPDRLWRGEPLAGRTLLVWAEQGLGDTFNFARFLPLLAQRARRLLVAVQPPLVGLFRESFPASEIITLAEREKAEFDCHIPLMSLPGRLQSRPEKVPGRCPYLKVPEKYRKKWRERLSAGGKDSTGNRRVGLVWSSNPVNVKIRGRSLPAALAEPLFRLPGVDFYVLQKELRAEDRRMLQQLPPEWQKRVTDLSAELETFQDTAAILRELDMLISVDTSVPHLAGALGVPTWLLLPFNADWRWLTGREDTVWYPSVRLFRQPRPGDWEPVLERVREELRRKA